MAIGPWAARAFSRRGMVALCVVGSGVLATAASLMTSGCAGLDGRAVLRIGYAAAIAAGDRNADGALDRAEVTALVEDAVPPGDRAGAGWDALRTWLVAGYMAQDMNGDGRLTPGELVRGQPETACGDLDGDGGVSVEEQMASLGRCPEGTLPYAGPAFGPTNRE